MFAISMPKSKIFPEPGQLPFKWAPPRFRLVYEVFYICLCAVRRAYFCLAIFRYSIGRMPVLFLNSSAKRLEVV